jgi:hypothetical protein
MPDPLDDAPMISAFIMFEARCLACITSKTGIPRSRVRRALVRIGRHLTLAETRGTCTSCGRRTTVVQVGTEP